MSDPRIRSLAKILVRYSIAAESRQTVAVNASPVAEPLVEAVYEELVRAGAWPVVRLAPDALREILLKRGKPHHFTELTPYQRAGARHVDANIYVKSQSNTQGLSGTNPRRQTQLLKTAAPLRQIVTRKPWVLTLYPTTAYAQDAGMSLRELEDFVYAATFADRARPVRAWQAMARRQERLIGRLKGADQVRIVGPDTDLVFSVKKRRFINSDGKRNMPSGEIFTGPVETSAEGVIRFDYPVCYLGREIEGVRLVFRKGVVVEADAIRGRSFLLRMLDLDRGARRLGEFGIGTNEQIQTFMRNILFDEKIGGSIHLAVGRSYPETGGTNRSSIHWDMIKDLRHGGAVYVDGKVFQKDGKFV